MNERCRCCCCCLCPPAGSSVLVSSSWPSTDEETPLVDGALYAASDCSRSDPTAAGTTVLFCAFKFFEFNLRPEPPPPSVPICQVFSPICPGLTRLLPFPPRNFLPRFLPRCRPRAPFFCGLLAAAPGRWRNRALGLDLADGRRWHSSRFFDVL